MHDYERYLAAVRERPLERETLFRGLVWAICHVHNQVVTGEREYLRWATTGELPNTLPLMRHRGIRDAHRFAYTVNLARFQRLPLRGKLEAIVGAIYGLSYAKATFALTCIGQANVACIDVHIGRKYGVRTQWRNAGAYLASVKQAYGKVHGSGDEQWRDYYRVIKAFRRSNHAPFFATIGVEVYGQVGLFQQEVAV